MIVVMMIVTVMMVVMVVAVVFDQAAHASAERVAMGAIGNVRSGCICTLTFDVVVVAFLAGCWRSSGWM